MRAELARLSERESKSFMKKIPAIFIALLFIFCLPRQLLSQAPESLDWQLRFIKGRNRESMQINRPIRMETGEVFRLIIEADADSYCYVICYDSERQIFVLHNQALKGGTEVSIGPIVLTEPSGTETIYVIMSFSRFADLERLITLYENSASRQNVTNLYREVIRLQNAASGLGEPAMAIISSGGTSRSAEEEQDFATKFTGKETYVRAISIRH